MGVTSFQPIATFRSISGINIPQRIVSTTTTTTVTYSSSSPSDVEDTYNNNNNDEVNDITTLEQTVKSNNNGKLQVLECTITDENENLKRELFKIAATYDRGYGANPTIRKKAMNIIKNLQQNNKCTNVASTILNNNDNTMTTLQKYDNNNEERIPSIQGNWRMIWTTAVDVLLLQASPIFSVGAIHQCFDIKTRVVTNVIDFIPRIQSLLPPIDNINSLIRAKVQTKACQPTGTIPGEYPNRIGLIFEAVNIQPVQVLGLDTNILPPLAFDLPKLPTITGSTQEESPGYFDVTYLDNELLIIQQNQPGGLFVLLRVDSID